MYFKKSMTNLVAFLSFIILLSMPLQASGAAIDDVRTLVDRYYVDPVGEEVLNQPTIDEIVAQLDDYSVYFTAEEFQQFSDGLNNSYVGIGVAVQAVNEQAVITQVFPNSAADEGGVEPNDQIVSVGGEVISDLTLEQTIAKITGPEGTTVSITFYRPETDSTFTKTLTRKKISFPTVFADKLAGNVGYMAINSFNQSTIEQMVDAKTTYRDVEHWIVDLRNNGGGYLDVAQKVVGMFPGAEITLVEETRDSRQKLASIKQETQFSEKIDLLVNEYSASASEITAGALQDYNLATLYGETTYGKGVMQSLFQFPSGDYMKLTTARFYTPTNRMINNVGISPDVWTETPLADAHLAWFEKKYANYKELTTMEDVAPDKVFHIQASTSVNASTFTDDKIELIQLGRKNVPITITKDRFNQISVTPKEDLVAGAEYLLLIHPGWQSTAGKASDTGIRMKVTVKQ
ncbi:S41 family peptidase [Aquibacillus salsiterrae]|uniref:S41 family peptidase n=1 Tax=Aquibacillus salsiterrae TaxID=2950439 RepID=A0A9X4AFW7_9BACI|nr:S41 family peptidase [Aquibacillus salsiterrae]MDC3416665.1 S41 family peptidase [Aquibacillus salsiterrae]